MSCETHAYSRTGSNSDSGDGQHKLVPDLNRYALLFMCGLTSVDLQRTAMNGYAMNSSRLSIGLKRVGK